MEPDSLRFGSFLLDPANRMLLKDGAPVELSGRYLDALVLLLREAGRLVPKERFMDEIWRGVPVTDEALTQCIRSLRRALGDDAARPHFIETVPKHGYRFVAAVVAVSGTSGPTPPPLRGSSPPLRGRGLFDWRHFLLLAGAGVVGGGLAGLLGGILYGVAGAGETGAGATSFVLVLASLCVLVALTGAAGVSLGIAAAWQRGGGWPLFAGGGALGGLLVGGIAKLLGLDAFHLLVGQSPGDITGALEGAVLGGAVGLGVWLGRDGATLARNMLPAAVAGGAAGIAITALGGPMMAGSLALLGDMLPQSQLRLDAMAMWFGEESFGRISQIATGGLEGMLFAAFIAGAMAIARRQISDR